MEIKEYCLLYDLEETYWWYVALRDIVFSYIGKIAKGRNSLKFLDAGCGTGILLSLLSGHKAFGFDISDDALQFCRKRNLTSLVQASACNIPYKGGSFDIVSSIDVIYHLRIKSDEEALAEINRVLKKGGYLILHASAYDSFRGKHDRAVHTRHKYTAKEVKEKVEKAGFEIEKLTYRNTLLFPMILIKRLLERIDFGPQREKESDLKEIPGFINKVFAGITKAENKLLGFVDFPFGSSIFCVARKI
ncbi:MAG: class I SAM-dependent methyltransferase [Candidatus Omnitrophica bacterium]|nr:class I SAM-dependent methyltransferase [Candidatus Omnitrophota bacterium]